MKGFLMVFLLLAFLLPGCSKKESGNKIDVQPKDKKILKKQEDLEILSYRMGFDSTIITLQNFPEADAESICNGVKDAFEKPMEPKYNNNVFNRAIANYKKDKVNIDAKKRLGEFLVNKPVSEKFMAEKAKIKGIMKFDNGILMETLKQGSGDTVTLNDIVEIHYQAWDAKNKLFDSSFKRNRTSKFNLNELVKGLAFGLQQMKKGGRYRLYIPQEMGYGSPGYKERVESGMALLFEIDIINIERNTASQIPGDRK